MHNDKQLAQLAEPHHRGEAREIAAIDLGSNSFHMIVARIINGSIQVLSRLKQKVRLADGLAEVTLRYRLMPQLYFQSVSSTNQVFDLLYQFEF